MNKTKEDNPLSQIINANSIAFFGASGRPETMGSIIFSSMVSGKYAGKLYPIHPREKEIRGLPVFSGPADLPEIPDLVIMVLPTGVVNQSLEDCGKAGIKRAIVISGGFREVGGEGVQLEEELKSIAQTYGIRVIGPNCLGVANLHTRLNSTPLAMNQKPGAIGLVSQSGSFITQMFDYLGNLGLAFSSAVSVGNEADLDMVDCMKYYATCPHSKVVALYIEGIKRGTEFIQAAKEISKIKPIVALYVGGSEAGRKAALSHTGSLSGPDQLYDSVFRQAGIIRANSVTELWDYCWALTTLPKPKGRNVVIQTHSGGPGASAADACSRNGLNLPTLSTETQEKLKPFLPHTASMANPVDLTFTRDQKNYFFDIPQVLLEDDGIDFLLIYLMMPASAMMNALTGSGLSEEESLKFIDSMYESAIDTFSKLKELSGKAIVGFTYRNMEETLIKGITTAGIPVFQDSARAANAIRAVVDYYETKQNRD